MKMRIQFLVLPTIFVIFSFLNAHVGLIEPKGGETFTVGSIMSIEWEEQVNHGASKWELYFSMDDGNTWNVIANNIDKAILTYSWKIPDTVATDHGKIKVIQNNVNGSDYNAISGAFKISDVTGIYSTGDPQNIVSFELEPAYPNPFNGIITIRFTLNSSSNVDITIYNSAGEQIDKLVHNNFHQGKHLIRWKPNNVASGIYCCFIKSGELIKTQRLVYIK